jgi:hypothetical protein
MVPEVATPPLGTLVVVTESAATCIDVSTRPDGERASTDQGSGGRLAKAIGDRPTPGLAVPTD